MYRALRTFRAIFPAEMEIKGRAVVAGALHPKVWDHLFETLKSHFLLALGLLNIVNFPIRILES